MERWEADPIQLRDVALYNLLTIARHALKLEVGPLVEAMRGHVDFTKGLSAPQVSLHESLIDQARWLLSQRLISPSSINWARLETLATTRPLMVRKQYWGVEKIDGKDPHSPVFWLAVSPQETWAEFLAFINAVEDTAKRADLYRGYFAACLARPELHGYKYNPPDFRDAEALMLLPLIEHLGAQVASLAPEVASDLTETWLLAWHSLHWTVPITGFRRAHVYGILYLAHFAGVFYLLRGGFNFGAFVTAGQSEPDRFVNFLIYGLGCAPACFAGLIGLSFLSNWMKTACPRCRCLSGRVADSSSVVGQVFGSQTEQQTATHQDRFGNPLGKTTYDVTVPTVTTVLVHDCHCRYCNHRWKDASKETARA